MTLIIFHSLYMTQEVFLEKSVLYILYIFKQQEYMQPRKDYSCT